MMTMNAIKTLCENNQFTHDMMINEIQQRVSNDKVLTTMWEAGMRAATTDEERKTVIFVIFDNNEECKEIFATYLYYKLRNAE